MLLYPGNGAKNSWVCDCRPRFLYFPLNDSCYEAYRQGPCSYKNYVVLLKNEVLPRCVENPCSEDGVVPYNGVCYPLRTIGGPCAPTGVLGVNKTTFQLECIPLDIAPFMIITTVPKRMCPPGSRRSMLGICRKVWIYKSPDTVSCLFTVVPSAYLHFIWFYISHIFQIRYDNRYSILYHDNLDI